MNYSRETAAEKLGFISSDRIEKIENEKSYPMDKRWLIRVLFPAPEGAETIMSFPINAITCFLTCAKLSNFNELFSCYG